MRIRLLPLLTAVLVLGGLLWALSIQSTTVMAGTDEPSLSFGTDLQVEAGETITVPVHFANAGNAISSVVFSIDFDQRCLRFDASDRNGDGTPDAVAFNIPPQFSGLVTYEEEDTDGEVDVVVADFAPPLAVLADSETFMAMRFTAICQPPTAAGQIISIGFSVDPAASFGSTTGQNITGTVTAGSILILPTTSFTPEPTATPTATPMPTPTPTNTSVPVPNNHDPAHGNDTAVTDEDTVVIIAVLQNDHDPDGDPLTVSTVTAPRHGTVLLNADQTITYSPATNYFGDDNFDYTIIDGRGGSATAAVNITINPINDPPEIAIDPTGQTYITGETVTLPISANDPDTPGASLTYRVEGLPPGITLDSQTRFLTGTLTNDAAGFYTVTVTVSDGELSDSVQFEWNVIAATVRIFLPLLSR